MEPVASVLPSAQIVSRPLPSVSAAVLALQDVAASEPLLEPLLRGVLTSVQSKLGVAIEHGVALVEDLGQGLSSIGQTQCVKTLEEGGAALGLRVKELATTIEKSAAHKEVSRLCRQSLPRELVWRCLVIFVTCFMMEYRCNVSFDGACFCAGS